MAYGRIHFGFSTQTIPAVFHKNPARQLTEINSTQYPFELSYHELTEINRRSHCATIIAVPSAMASFAMSNNIDLATDPESLAIE